MNGNTSALTVVTETRNYQIATLIFSHSKMFSTCEIALERNLYSPIRTRYAHTKNSSENYQQNTGSDSSVGVVLLTEKVGFEAFSGKNHYGHREQSAVSAISNTFRANYTSRTTNEEETLCPWTIKFMMSCVRTTLRG